MLESFVREQTVRFGCLPRRLAPGSRFWQHFQSQRGPTVDVGIVSRCDLGAFPDASLQALGSGSISSAPDGSPDASPQDVGPGCISERLRGPAVGPTIIPPGRSCDFGALQTPHPRTSALAVFPSPREGRQQAGESKAVRFRCPPDASPHSGCISEPYFLGGVPGSNLSPS